GKMGKAIERIAKERKHQITAVIDPFNNDCIKEISKENLNNAEICIEFSTPTAFRNNMEKLAETGIHTVTGTTGWYENKSEIFELFNKNNCSLLWGSNFSIGMNVFYLMLEKASAIINKAEMYDVSALEVHHKEKKDSPSGTACVIADILVENIERKTNVKYDISKDKINENTIHFASLRNGWVPGSHSVMIDSEFDTIELSHKARNRNGFALGAVMAAEWFIDKKGIYRAEDFFKRRFL
ncbi:MAG: 4-hydroxy-tetrahydrodipicolinate reductase, partial [Candidatus Muiribacteriota bacterium]